MNHYTYPTYPTYEQIAEQALRPSDFPTREAAIDFLIRAVASLSGHVPEVVSLAIHLQQES